MTSGISDEDIERIVSDTEQYAEVDEAERVDTGRIYIEVVYLLPHSVLCG